MRKLSSTILLVWAALLASPTATRAFFVGMPQTSRNGMESLAQSSKHVDCDPAAQERRYILTSGLAFMGSLAVFPNVAMAKTLGEEYRQGTAALENTESSAPVPREAYKKLDSGVVYADLFKGPADDPSVSSGKKVSIQWVLRKSNGYFVDSSEVGGGVPFIFTVGDETAIKGVDEGIRGMRQGGIRRLLIPPSLAYVNGLEDGKPGPLPAGFGPRQQMRRIQTARKDVPGEYIFLEVQVTRVR